MREMMCTHEHTPYRYTCSATGEPHGVYGTVRCKPWQHTVMRHPERAQDCVRDDVELHGTILLWGWNCFSIGQVLATLRIAHEKRMLSASFLFDFASPVLRFQGTGIEMVRTNNWHRQKSSPGKKDLPWATIESMSKLSKNKLATDWSHTATLTSVDRLLLAPINGHYVQDTKRTHLILRRWRATRFFYIFVCFFKVQH